MDFNNTTLAWAGGVQTGTDYATLVITLNALGFVAYFLTSITNIITVLIIATTPSLRTCTNAFLVSFAVSDLLFGLFMFGLLFAIIVYTLHPFRVNLIHFWDVVFFAWGLLILSSNGNLILVSLERWLYITQPFWYQQLVSATTVKVSIAIIWITSFFLNIPFFFIKQLVRKRRYWAILHAYLSPVIHTVCSLLLLCIYIHITFITYQQLEKIFKTQRPVQREDPNTLQSANSSRSIHAENWKAVKLLIIICGLFFLFATPFVYFFAYMRVNQTDAKDQVILQVFLLMLAVQHCSNFFVYILKLRQFREVFKIYCVRLCCCCLPRSNRVNNGNRNVHSGISLVDLQSRRTTHTAEHVR